MDKATKVAVEKYPHGTFDGELGDSLRAACAVGYMQAEKDLALTPEDIVVLINLYEYGKAQGWTVEEVLSRFNERNNGKSD